MSKWLKYFMTLVLGSATPFLGAWDCCGCGARASVDFEAGYRHDELSWNFSAPVCDPIFKSNLSFEDIHIFQIGVSAKAAFDCGYARASASWGWVLDGDFKEHLKFDTDDDDTEQLPCEEVHTIETAESDSVLDGRYVVDLSAAIGYPFYFCCCQLQVVPVIGYSYNEQNIRLEPNSRLFFDPAAASVAGNVNRQLDFSTCDCVDFHFVTKWWGPFIGVDFNYNPCDCWRLFAQIEAHWAHFKGKRQSNSGFCPFDDFDRSSHKAHGYVVKVGGEYDFCDCWFFDFDFTYQDWSAHKKSHTGSFVYQTSPLIEFDCDDHFRSKVKLHSYAIGVSVGRSF